MPGSRQGIHTLSVDGINFLTEEEDIDKALAKYWQDVFGPPTLSEGAQATTQRWLQDLGEEAYLQGPPPEWDDKWVEVACKRATTSSPGLDGIPYEAYTKHPQFCTSSRKPEGNSMSRGKAPASLRTSIGQDLFVVQRKWLDSTLP